MAKIHIIDDEQAIRETLSQILIDEGHNVSSAESFKGIGIANDIELILLDVKLENENGLTILESIREKDNIIPVVMISGHGTIEMAVEAIKRGANDFLEKPLRLERVVTSVDNALRIDELQKEVSRIKYQSSRRISLIGQSMNDVKNKIRKVALSDQPVFITGEKGTGRSLVVQNLLSQSRDKYILVDLLCNNLTEEEIIKIVKENTNKKRFIVFNNFLSLSKRTLNIIMSEVKKILNLSLASTRSSIESGDRFVFILDTSKDDLASDKLKLITSNIVFKISLPPLRERNDDINELLSGLAKKIADKVGVSPIEFSEEAILFLKSYAWPANVRQLVQFIERLTVLSLNEVVDLQMARSHLNELSEQFSLPEQTQGLKKTLQSFERNYILYIIQKNKGNITKAAEELEVERTHLYRKLHKLGLEKAREDVLDTLEK